MTNTAYNEAINGRPNQADAEPTDQELISKAMTRGYTREVWAENDHHTLNLLVQKDIDLDGRFVALDLDECEFLRVNGWLFSIEGAG